MSSHYAVLGLQPAMLDSSPSAATATALLRQAYRRALLRHHPDKQRQAQPQTHSQTHSQPQSQRTPSIDQITEAWAVLSSPARRRAYDRERAQERGLGISPAEATGPMATGMESVDLDDLAWDAGAEQWFRGCRCGNDRGFVFGEADLEAEMEAAALAEQTSPSPSPSPSPSQSAGELLVGCQDCSLWLCVHFAVMDDG